MPGSAHHEKIAFFQEVTSGTPPADAAAWVADGHRMSPLRGSLDLGSIGPSLLTDERSADDVFDELPGELGIDNPEFSFDAYMTTLGVATPVDTDPVTTVFGRLLTHTLGGSISTQTTALTGGGHTTTTINVADAGARGIVAGSFVAVEIAAWTPGPTVCHPRRVLDVSGNTAVTLDAPLPLAPSDGDMCRGAVANFPDSTVLEDSSVGPMTLSWLLQRGRTGGNRNWLVRGSKAELGSLSFERNNYIKTSFKVLGGSSAGPNLAPSPAWTAIPSDDPPVSVGRWTELYLADHGAIGSTVAAKSLELTPGVPVIPDDTITDGAAGMQGRAGYTTGKAETVASIVVTPFDPTYWTDFEERQNLVMRFSKLASAGRGMAVHMSRASINAVPNFEGDEVAANTLVLKGLRDDESVGTGQAERAKFHIVRF